MIDSLALPGDGFYAAAYRWAGSIGNDDTVISYRGTDNFSPSILASDARGWSDIWGAWTVGLGLAQPSAQALDAFDFYRQVAHRDSIFSSAPANLVLTGHSLGGGLAGLVSSISGARGVGFDHMPFGVSAYMFWLSESVARATGLSNQTAAPAQPDWNTFHAYFTQGEALQFIRNGASQASTGALLAYLGPSLAALGIVAGQIGGVTTALLEASIANERLSTFGGLTNPIDLHSQNLLVLLKYADETGRSDWQPLASIVLPALFDPKPAEALGLNTTTGSAEADAQLRSILAYSAIDEGEKPFGDKAIQAFFNDADQLGRLEVSLPADALLSDGAIEAALAKIVVQYAGDIGLQHATADKLAEGVIGIRPTDGLFQVDLDPARWSTTFAQSQHTIAGLDPFVTAVENRITTAEVVPKSHDGLSAAFADWQSAAKDVTLVSAVVSDGAGAYQIDTLPVAKSGSEGGWIFLGGSGAEAVSGGSGKDLVLAGAGNDTLRGGSGGDVLYGGDGDDTLVAADIDVVTLKGDALIGGAGADTFVISYSDGMLRSSGGVGVITIYDATAEDRLYVSENTLSQTVPGGSAELLRPLLGGTQVFSQSPQFWIRNGTVTDQLLNAYHDQHAAGGVHITQDGIREWDYYFFYNDERAVHARYEKYNGDLLVFLDYYDALVTSSSLASDPSYLGTVEIRVVDYHDGDLGLTLFAPPDPYFLDIRKPSFQANSAIYAAQRAPARRDTDHSWRQQRDSDCLGGRTAQCIDRIARRDFSYYSGNAGPRYAARHCRTGLSPRRKWR